MARVDTQRRDPRRAIPGPLVTADGKRLFVGGTLGRLQVHNTENRVPKATLFATTPKKNGLPGWYILTVTDKCVGSSTEVESLVKSGKVKNTFGVR